VNSGKKDRGDAEQPIIAIGGAPPACRPQLSAPTAGVPEHLQTLLELFWTIRETLFA
jgi:hypothetical protein